MKDFKEIAFRFWKYLVGKSYILFLGTGVVPLTWSGDGIPAATHQIHISGWVHCDENKFYNFTSLVVQVWDKNKYVFEVPVGKIGEFDSKEQKALKMNHTVRLISKSSGKTMDEQVIQVDESKPYKWGTEKYFVQLDACKEASHKKEKH